MNIKDIINQPNLQAIQEVSEQMNQLKKAFAVSPAIAQITEQMRQLSGQQAMFNDRFKEITQAFRLDMPDHMRAINEITRGVSPFIEQVQRMHSPYRELMKAFQEQVSPFQEACRQFQEFHERINFPEIGKILHGFTDIVRSIPRDRLLRFRLHSEYWLVADDELLALVIEENIFESEKVIPFVVGYYKSDNWAHLSDLVDTWRSEIAPERFKVFHAAIQTTRDASTADVHLLTVPTLIAQIDGLVRDLYSTLPQATKKKVEKEIRDNLPEEMKNRRTDVRQEVAVQTVAEVVNFWSAEILQEVIFSGLFRDSNKINPDQSYSLFRHKIMHGDKDYILCGNEENFIRLMLYAEFIIQVIRQIRNGVINLEQVA